MRNLARPGQVCAPALAKVLKPDLLALVRADEAHGKNEF